MDNSIHLFALSNWLVPQRAWYPVRISFGTLAMSTVCVLNPLGLRSCDLYVYGAPDLSCSPSIPSRSTAQEYRSDPDLSESPQPWLLPPIRVVWGWLIWVQAGHRWAPSVLTAAPEASSPSTLAPTLLQPFCSFHSCGAGHHTLLWGSAAPGLYYLEYVKQPSFSFPPPSPLEQPASRC